MTESFRVIVGHEPRFYRESLAEALPCRRPDLAVTLSEPAALDEDVRGADGPCLVVCSRLSPVIMAYALAWVLVYPDGENRAVLSLAGHERSTPGLGIDQLLAFIAEAERLVPGD